MHAENTRSSHIYLLNTFVEVQNNQMRERKNTYWKRDKIRSRTKWKRTNERSKEWTTHKRTNTSWYSSVFLCVNWYEFLYFFSHAALDRRVLVCMCARLISPIEHFLVLIVCCHCWCYLLSQTLVLTTEHILSMSDDFPIKKLVRWRTLYTHTHTSRTHTHIHSKKLTGVKTKCKQQIRS